MSVAAQAREREHPILGVSTAPHLGCLVNESRPGYEVIQGYDGLLASTEEKLWANISTVCSLCFAAGPVRGLGTSALNKKENEGIHCVFHRGQLMERKHHLNSLQMAHSI